jgi:hypothetical protein
MTDQLDPAGEFLRNAIWEAAWFAVDKLCSKAEFVAMVTNAANEAFDSQVNNAAVRVDHALAAQPKPEAAQEYIAYATAWIDALPNGDNGGERRWKEERGMRCKADVGADDREALFDRLDRRLLARKFPKPTLKLV